MAIGMPGPSPRPAECPSHRAPHTTIHKKAKKGQNVNQPARRTKRERRWCQR
jgi:hypothetical protein